MPEVPRQRGAAATPRAGLQPGHLPALHRLARGHGRLVPHQPATETDQDRRPRRASRSRHHLSNGRGGGHRPDGARHPRRRPPIASASVMCMTTIRTQTERKRQDRSVRCAEKHRRRAGMLRVYGPICPTSGDCATTDDARGGKRLISWRSQAILTSEGRPLGECRLRGANGGYIRPIYLPIFWNTSRRPSSVTLALGGRKQWLIV